jgi:hypothetical protein
MTMIVLYPTKKELKDSIGEPLKYQETSMFGNEYRSNGSFSGCNRPHLTGFKREFFARITMADGKISRVE